MASASSASSTAGGGSGDIGGGGGGFVPGPGEIPKPKGKSGARPSHEEMYAQMGLQGSEYWQLWEIAKSALLRSTLEHSKWRLVTEAEKRQSGQNLFNDSRLGDRHRAVLETPWVMDYFLKTRWNIDRSNRRYVRNPAPTSVPTGITPSISEGEASTLAPSPTPTSPRRPQQPHRTTSTGSQASTASTPPPAVIAEFAAAGTSQSTSGGDGSLRREGIGWMLNEPSPETGNAEK